MTIVTAQAAFDSSGGGRDPNSPCHPRSDVQIRTPRSYSLARGQNELRDIVSDGDGPRSPSTSGRKAQSSGAVPASGTPCSGYCREGAGPPRASTLHVRRFARPDEYIRGVAVHVTPMLLLLVLLEIARLDPAEWARSSSCVHLRRARETTTMIDLICCPGRVSWVRRRPPTVEAPATYEHLTESSSPMVMSILAQMTVARAL